MLTKSNQVSLMPRYSLNDADGSVRLLTVFLVFVFKCLIVGKCLHIIRLRQMYVVSTGQNVVCISLVETCIQDQHLKSQLTSQWGI